MKKFALLGEHLSHSYSPLIHEYLFKRQGLNYSYSLLECKIDELEDILNKLRNDEYSGYNVTIPYKKEVMKYLDEISEEAIAIGSVNTIKCVNNKLIGYNTDYDGFIYELAHYDISVENKNCYVLGTGGASLAIIKALKDLKANVYNVSRRKSDSTITYQDLDNANIDIIVNTTPVGMYPNTLESPIEKSIAIKAETIVDIIFNPTKTKLMSYNKNSYNGLLMLIGQAYKAEEIWLNKRININLDDVYKYVCEVKNCE